VSLSCVVYSRCVVLGSGCDLRTIHGSAAATGGTGTLTESSRDTDRQTGRHTDSVMSSSSDAEDAV